MEGVLERLFQIIMSEIQVEVQVTSTEKEEWEHVERGGRIRVRGKTVFKSRHYLEQKWRGDLT